MRSNQTASEKGRYLYADYTPFEENKNYLAMLKDFVNLCHSIFQIQKDLEVLHSTLTNAELLQKEIISKIEQFRASIQNSLDKFQRDYNEMVKTRLALHATASEGGTVEDGDVFLKAKSSLIQMLANTKEEYSKRADQYNEYLKSKITDSKRNAVRLLEEWLSNDNYEMPYTITSKILTRLEVSIDNSATTKHYTVTKTSTATLQQNEDNKDNFSNTNNNNKLNRISNISYSLSTSSPNLDFWNYRRKVSEVDVKDIMIPFGLKTPVTEKIRQSFRIIPGLSKEPVEKEPGFVNVDSYYIVSAALDDKNKTFSVLLANNPLELDYNVIRISYEIPELYSEKTTAERYAEGKLPKIDCTLKDGEMQDVLRVKEIAESTDVSKIILFGRALMDKITLLTDPSIWSSRGKLIYIRIDGKDAVSVAVRPEKDSPLPTSHSSHLIHYDAEQVAFFLDVVAKNFAPIIRKLKEKSVVKGELILRYENEDGSREEYTVKIEEFNSLLQTTDNGKKIADLLLLTSTGTDGTSSLIAGAS